MLFHHYLNPIAFVAAMRSFQEYVLQPGRSPKTMSVLEDETHASRSLPKGTSVDGIVGIQTVFVFLTTNPHDDDNEDRQIPLATDFEFSNPGNCLHCEIA